MLEPTVVTVVTYTIALLTVLNKADTQESEIPTHLCYQFEGTVFSSLVNTLDELAPGMWTHARSQCYMILLLSNY